MMGRAVLAFLVVGCSFTPGVAPQMPDGEGTKAFSDSKTFTDSPPCPDEDHDGVCDAVDDWPCGPKPTAPAATVMWDQANSMGQHMTMSVSNTMVNGATLLAVAP